MTAQKRSQKLQNVPVTVSAFSAKQLVQQGITSANDLGQHVAALSISEGAGTITPFLRGVGNPDQANGNESSVAVYLDDVYVARLDPAFLQLSDISRIEVLEGPQGTLFGRNASAGVINIFSKNPSDVLQGSASFSYDNYNTSTEKLYLSGPIAPGINANLSVLNAWQADGWGRDLTNHTPIGYVDPFIIKSKWVFNLSSTTTLRLQADYSHSSSNVGIFDNNVPGTTSGSPSFYALPPYNLAPIKYTNSASFYNSTAYYPFTDHKEGFGGAARLDQDLGFGQFSSIMGYRQNREDFTTDASYAPEAGVDAHLSSHVRTFTEELQLASKPGTRLDWIVGLFYLNDFASYEPVSEFGPGLATDVLGGAFGPVISPQSALNLYAHQRTKEYAAYTQGTLHLPYNTNFTAGFRYTIDDLTGGGNNQVSVPGIGVFNSPAKAANDFTKPTFKFILDHHFASTIMAYVSASRGSKSATFNLLPFTVPVTKPEVLTAYEAGFKTTLLDNTLQLNGAAFYYDYAEPQVEEIINQLIFLTNAKAAKVRGLELSGQYILTNELSAHFGATYLDSHYTSFENAPVFSLNPLPPFGAVDASGNADGKELPDSPKFSFYVGLDYTHSFSFGRLDLDTNYSFKGSYYFNPDNLIRQKAYGLLDASLTYKLPHNDRYALRLWGKNITGSKYFIGTAENSGSGGLVYAPAAPAVYGATVTYAF